MTTLADKEILLGVCGGIAAYKACDWTRALRREGAAVTVVMTESASRFVASLTFAALSGRPVYGSMFAAEEAERIPHITLARQADAVLIAPATARTIARLAHGLADDLLATVVLATTARVVVCPAMNSQMYRHPATQANLAKLRKYGYTVVEPACGTMACGEEGPGRLVEWEEARQALLAALSRQDLADLDVLVTAGPTWEPLDPARMLTNRATGRMGYAVAAAARQRGAHVTLVSGPTGLATPAGVEVIRVTSALEMHREVTARAAKMDVVVKTAAVADFRPATSSTKKIKKGAAATTIALAANPDILKELGEKKAKAKRFPLLVGFAAESDNLRAEARKKLKAKNLDLIVANDITATDAGFAAPTNRVLLIDRNGNEQELPLLGKEETAHRIWDAVVAFQR
ncbi:MAG: bifunctional phosphopantothenoylcysteine decarboxylase/phosphopantothenate--cysteine ligase CoaBC [Thermodesulfobacteriota bacterium]